MTKTIFKRLMLILLLVLSKSFFVPSIYSFFKNFSCIYFESYAPYFILGVFVGSSMDMEIFFFRLFFSYLIFRSFFF